MNKYTGPYVVAIAVALVGCTATIPHSRIKSDVIKREQPAQEQQLTVAAAQRIARGTSNTEVIKQLGSPNIITKGKKGGESWVYDRMGRQVSAITTTSGGWLFMPSQKSSSSSVSEKSLTVVIDFDSDGRVAEITYRRLSY